MSRMAFLLEDCFILPIPGSPVKQQARAAAVLECSDLVQRLNRMAPPPSRKVCLP